MPKITTRQANAIAKDLNAAIARIQAAGGPTIYELREAETLTLEAFTRIRDARLAEERPPANG